MCSQDSLNRIIERMHKAVQGLFPGERVDVILFSSYARGDADEHSDVDLMMLVDAPQEKIAEKHWQVGDAAGEILLDYGVVVSPIVGNRAFFLRNRETMPFLRNIQREGNRGQCMKKLPVTLPRVTGS